MWEVVDKELYRKVEEYARSFFGEMVSEKFIEEVYGDVCLTSGYEEEGIYSQDDIVICFKRNVVEMINENY